jgi:hypothetical protein
MQPWISERPLITIDNKCLTVHDTYGRDSFLGKVFQASHYEWTEEETLSEANRMGRREMIVVIYWKDRPMLFSSLDS